MAVVPASSSFSTSSVCMALSRSRKPCVKVGNRQLTKPCHLGKVVIKRSSISEQDVLNVDTKRYLLKAVYFYMQSKRGN